MPRSRRNPGAWDEEIIPRAGQIVASYETGVTLRQLFYQLVSAGLLLNTQTEYAQLSARTAEARRAGAFPALLDRTRRIHRDGFWGSPDELLRDAISAYRLDRTRGQLFKIYIGVEKNGLVEQLRAWFGEYGVPILALGGYSSQTYKDAIIRDIADQAAEDRAGDGRRSVLLYGGDFDPSGKDILRDFTERVQFAEVVQVALTAAQVDKYNLPPMPGKASDSRAARFVREHGRLVQVEIDALPPDVLKSLFLSVFQGYFSPEPYAAVLVEEAEGRQQLARRFG